MDRIMVERIVFPARRFAALSVFALLALGGAALAAPADPVAAPPLQIAQATTPAAPSASAPAKTRPSPAERVDARIKSLHDRLKITSAQEPQWNAVAQVMRENAQSMDQVIQQRHQTQNMTAVDDLKAYQSIAQAHLQNVQKLIPAFQTLYDTLSPEQKKAADDAFSRARGGPRRAAKKQG
jgi:periplasmic protein CpxP/Spy